MSDNASTDSVPARDNAVNWDAYAEMQQEACRHARHVFASHVDKLTALGITSVVVQYYGAGDDGEVQYVVCYDKGHNVINVDDQELLDAVGNAAFDMTPPGFVNNDGGQGAITVDIVNRKITREHEQNYIATESDNAEWEF